MYQCTNNGELSMVWLRVLQYAELSAKTGHLYALGSGDSKQYSLPVNRKPSLPPVPLVTECSLGLTHTSSHSWPFFAAAAVLTQGHLHGKEE